MTASGRSRLPVFGIQEYVNLLSDLAARGYALRPTSEIAEPTVGDGGRAAYLRHDVDFHIRLVEPLAAAEADAGIRATYYVLLTQHYNLWQRDNRAALRALVDAGHEVGLHYDLETYPPNVLAARDQLRWEVETLERLSGASVRTIVMHQPSMGGTDIFLTIDDYVHPHDPRLSNGLLYVSDSCRAWRDSSLLQCWEDDPPRRLLLNTHPELWLDAGIADPLEYLDLLIDRSTQQYGAFIDSEVRASWAARHRAERR